MQPNNPLDSEWREAPTAPLNPFRRYAKAPRWPAPSPQDNTYPDPTAYPAGYGPSRYPPPAPYPHPLTRPPRQAPSWFALHAAQIAVLAFGVIEVLIIIRVVLKLFAANPVAEFSSFVYTFTDPFVAPFQGVFPSPTGHDSVLELSSLLAILVYALLGKLARRIAQIAQPRGPRGY